MNFTASQKTIEVNQNSFESSTCSNEDRNNICIIASQQEVIKNLKYCYINIPNYHKRLLFFTLKHIGLYFHSRSIKNNTADEVVQIVLDKILTGKRKWNKEQFPDFTDFVRMVILSYIRNEYKRIEKAEILVIDETNYNCNGYYDYYRTCIREDAEDAIFRESQEELIKKLEELLKDDACALLVLEERLDGSKSNINIAEKLCIKVCEVENALKRIKNKIPQLLGRKLK